MIEETLWQCSFEHSEGKMVGQEKRALGKEVLRDSRRLCHESEQVTELGVVGLGRMVEADVTTPGSRFIDV